MATNYISSHTGAEVDAGISRVKTGGDVDAHITRTDNPHGVTAAQSGADPAGTASSQVSAHEAAADPHPGYALEADLGTASTADVTTSETDTTPGRVLKVGDFGSTSDALVVGSVDLDTLLRIGKYWVSSTSTNLPTAEAGIVEVFSSLATTEIATAQRFTLAATWSGIRSWIRHKDSVGVWKSWQEIYHSGSILGTVSQSGGVPTGAIIERGSNANGEYTKFADGTMICTRKLTTQSINPDSTLTTLWTFPATFNTPPITSTTIFTATPKSFSSSSTVQSGGEALIYAYNGLTAAFSRDIYCIAVGRWY